jgi:hypothetical protein
MSAIHGDGREAAQLAINEGAANKKLGVLIEKLDALSGNLCGKHFDEEQQVKSMQTFLENVCEQMIVLLQKNVDYANILNR